jgi:methylglutaconyl-CoA hydratase
MNYQTILYEVSAPLATITLNRPDKRNALNPQLVSELIDTFSAAESDSQCRVVLLRAEGKAFCSGMDLEALQKIATMSYEENLADSRKLAALFKKIYTLQKPVISLVQGPAVAGGCGLATVCDITLATPEAKFGYTEVRIGFLAAIVSVFLVRMIGEKRARELLLMGKLIDPQEALRIGLINEVLPADQILPRAKKLATELANNSPQGLASTKQSFLELYGAELDAQIEKACVLNAKARQSEDCKEGVKAFLEKRPPKWQQKEG